MKTLIVLLHVGGGVSPAMLLFLLLICAAVALLSKSGSQTSSSNEDLYTEKEVHEILDEYAKGIQEGIRQAKEKNS